MNLQIIIGQIITQLNIIILEKKNVSVANSLKAWNNILLDNVNDIPTSSLDIVAYNEIELLPGTIVNRGTTLKTSFPDGIDYSSIPPVSLSTIDCSR